MSGVVLVSLVRCGCLPTLCRRVCGRVPAPGGGTSLIVGGVRTVSGGPRVRQSRNSIRHDPDGSGRPTTWDSFGIWDNRIDEPIQLSSSIRYGKPIPQISMSKIGTASVLGQRKQNEDRLLVGRIHDNVLYFAVFDGHGGSHAAEFCNTHIHTQLRQCLEEEDDLEKVLTKAFLDLDASLYAHLSILGNASLLNVGTTATVAVLRDGVELVVGSVGDSRALLCRKGRAKKLTHDHTPDRKDEKERVKRSGGFVAFNSLGQANVNGRLAMTRSIGDFDLKKSGVIAVPETRRINVQHHHDTFLALTSDGINFLMNDQEICDVINQCHDPEEAAQVIAEQALQYGSEDNSSIVVVPLGAWGKQESSLSGYSMSRNLVSSGRWA